MLVVGLTGGIGSGKTTVAAGLAERGASVIDADRIARQIVEPAGPAYQPLVDRFGRAILHEDGTVNRPALASVVFSDPAARADLNAITHPMIARAMGERIAALAATAGTLILDVPLLTAETVRSYGLGAVIVVDTPTDTAVARLVAHRAFEEADARARVSAQMGREERRALIDLVPVGQVIDNSGDAVALDQEVARVWTWLTGLL